MHIDGFFNSKVFEDNQKLVEEVAVGLIDMYVSTGWRTNRIQWVVGPKLFAGELVKAMAQEVGRRNGWECKSMLTLKVGLPGRQYMRPATTYQPWNGVSALIVDDSTFPTRNGRMLVECVRGLDMLPLPFICLPFNGSAKPTLSLSNNEELKVLSLCERPLRSQEPWVCDLCAVKSHPYDLDETGLFDENWGHLTVER